MQLGIHAVSRQQLLESLETALKFSLTPLNMCLCRTCRTRTLRADMAPGLRLQVFGCPLSTAFHPACLWTSCPWCAAVQVKFQCRGAALAELTVHIILVYMPRAITFVIGVGPHMYPAMYVLSVSLLLLMVGVPPDTLCDATEQVSVVFIRSSRYYHCLNGCFRSYDLPQLHNNQWGVDIQGNIGLLRPAGMTGLLGLHSEGTRQTCSCPKRMQQWQARYDRTAPTISSLCYCT